MYNRFKYLKVKENFKSDFDYNMHVRMLISAVNTKKRASYF